MSFFNRLNDILLLVGIVCSCIGCIKIEELGERNGLGVSCSAGEGIHRIVNERHRCIKVSVVFANVGAFISHDILVEGRQISTVVLLIVLTVMAQA